MNLTNPNNPLTDVLTPTVRKRVYAAYAAGLLALTALAVLGVTAVHGFDLSNISSAWQVIGIGIGATAASNIPQPATDPAVDDVNWDTVDDTDTGLADAPEGDTEDPNPGMPADTTFDLNYAPDKDQ